MPFREVLLWLRDISDAINAIEEFTRGMDYAFFRQDPKTVAAAERKLQLLSEAAVRLGEQAETLCPGLPWRNIRGIGKNDLPPLKAAIHRALDPPPSKPNRPALV